MNDSVIGPAVLEYLNSLLKLMDGTLLTEEEFIKEIEAALEASNVEPIEKVAELYPDEVEAILLELSISRSFDKKIPDFKVKNWNCLSIQELPKALYGIGFLQTTGKLAYAIIFTALARSNLSSSTLGRICLAVVNDELCICTGKEKQTCDKMTVTNNFSYDLENWDPKGSLIN